MKRILWLIFLFLPALCYGAAGDVASIAGKAVTAVSTVDGKAGTAIASMAGKNYSDGDAGGYTNTGCYGHGGTTDCNYTTATGATNSLTADATRVSTWTASANGQVNRVKIYKTDCPADGTLIAVYYNGTELRGTASVTCANDNDEWIWSDVFSAYSARSLVFSSSDTVVFGFSFDYATTQFAFGRTAETTTPNYYGQAAYSPDPLSATTGNYYLGVILEYKY